MAWDTWLAYVTAAFVISLSPGAGAVYTMSNAIRNGWARSMWGILGQQIALIIHIVLVAAFFSVLVSMDDRIMLGIRWAGAAYLAYLGIAMLAPALASTARARRAPAEPARHEVDQEQGPVATDAPSLPGPTSAWAMVRHGILVNLLNPKALVFFLAFLPPFINTQATLWPQYAVITATSVGADILVMWFGFAPAALPLRRLIATTRGQNAVSLIFGLCFLGVASLLLVVG